MTGGFIANSVTYVKKVLKALVREELNDCARQRDGLVPDPTSVLHTDAKKGKQGVLYFWQCANGTSDGSLATGTLELEREGIYSRKSQPIFFAPHLILCVLLHFSMFLSFRIEGSSMAVRKEEIEETAERRDERLRRPLLERRIVDESQPHAERDASILSAAFLVFIQPVITLAEKLDTAMDVEDIDLPVGDDSADLCRERFAGLWSRETAKAASKTKSNLAKLVEKWKQEQQPSVTEPVDGDESKKFKDARDKEKEKATVKPSLYWAVFKFLGWPLFIAQLWGIFEAAGPFVSVALMAEINRFVGSARMVPIVVNGTATSASGSGASYVYYGTIDKEPLWYGAVLAAIFFVSQCFYTIGAAQAGRLLSKMELRIEAALKSVLVEKTINMTDEGAMSVGGSGALYQVFSSDVTRIAQTLPTTWRSVDIFIQGAAAQIYLFVIIGWPAFASIIILAVMLPFNHRQADQTISVFIRKTIAGDARTNKIVEILNAVRAVKLYAWERPYRDIVSKLRQPELEMMALLMKKIAYIMTSFGLSAPLIQIGVYVLLVYATDKPSVVVFFQSLSLIAILRQLTTRLPFLYVRYLQALTSVDRVQAVLEAKEREVGESPDYLQLGDIVVKDASFIWPTPPPSAGGGKGGMAALKAKMAGMSAAQIAVAKKRMMAANRSVVRSTGDSEGGSQLVQKLEHVNFEAHKGELVVIVGKVGAGKTSLVSALIGEMKHLDGVIGRSGKVAYVPQQPWILNSTLRNNILVNLPFDEARYEHVLAAADLTSDLLALPNGDLTEIGEKGINLSGGQKQRVSLARALYADADLYIFDDPLSALDAHVGKHVFETAIQDMLKDKTRVLVTHQMQLISSATRIYVAHDMKITEEEMPSADVISAAMDEANASPSASVNERGRGNVVKNGTEASPMGGETGGSVLLSMLRTWHSPVGKSEASPASVKASASPKSGGKNVKGDDSPKKSQGPSANSGDLTVREERESGRVKAGIVTAYFASFGGVPFWGAIITLQVLIVTVNIFSVLWFSFWTENRYPSFHTKYPTHFYIGIYAAAIIFDIFLVYVREVHVWRHGAVNAPRTLYDKMFMTVVAAPLAFFDTTPVGRIITRFTKDAGALDFALPMSANQMITSFFGQLGAMVATCAVVPWSTPIFVAALIVLLFVQPTVATLVLRRLSSTTSGPVFGLYSETLAGTGSVRVLGLTDFFCERFSQRIDERNAAAYADRMIFEFIKVRISILMAFVSAGLMLVIMGTREQLDASLAVFAISQSMKITLMMSTLMLQRASFMMSMNSVERIVDYSRLDGEEAGSEIPPADWPQRGEIEFQNVQAQYRPGLPMVLNNVSFTIRAGEKIGVAGRTGSGKSSLILTMFRLLPIQKGSVITIDGIDTSSMPLVELRSNIAAIPQEPVLFAGTVRENLDPSGEIPKERLLEALNRCKLTETLKAMQSGKKKGDGASPQAQSKPHTNGGSEDDATKSEGEVKPATVSQSTSGQSQAEATVTSEPMRTKPDAQPPEAKEELDVLELKISPTDLSVGQKQLLCLARAIVRNLKILVMDEATSSVDVLTDALIQETIRTVFKDSTVITIAHRLNTIMDSDRVLVLDKGSVVEFDSPSNLLSNEDSFFSQLASSSATEES